MDIVGVPNKLRTIQYLEVWAALMQCFGTCWFLQQIVFEAEA